MKQYILGLGCAFILWGCSQKENSKTVQPGFSYFELSYDPGGGRGLSFCTDSNRIFFLPQLLQGLEGNKVIYGLLPDSITQNINTLIRKLPGMISLNPGSTYCYHCSQVAVMAVAGEDTMRVFQAGEIDETTWKLIEQLETFKKTKKINQFVAAYFYLETMGDVLSLPPKVEVQ